MKSKGEDVLSLGVLLLALMPIEASKNMRKMKETSSKSLKAMNEHLRNYKYMEFVKKINWFLIHVKAIIIPIYTCNSVDNFVLS